MSIERKKKLPARMLFSATFAPLREKPFLNIEIYLIENIKTVSRERHKGRREV